MLNLQRLYDENLGSFNSLQIKLMLSSVHRQKKMALRWVNFSYGILSNVSIKNTSFCKIYVLEYTNDTIAIYQKLSSTSMFYLMFLCLE